MAAKKKGRCEHRPFPILFVADYWGVLGAMPDAGCGAAGSWLAAVGAALLFGAVAFGLGAGVGVVSGAVVFGVTAFGAAVPGAID